MVTHNEIKPTTKGKSDFFSWQLFRWVRKNPECTKVWAGTWNNCTGVDREKSVLYIGYERDGKWIHARQLTNLCTHGARLDCFAYGTAHDTENWVDVTDAFWSDYMKKGVCAIHGDYAHNWSQEGGRRTCSYCGKTEKRETRMVPTEVWVAA